VVDETGASKRKINVNCTFRRARFTISRRGLFCPISNLFIEHPRLFTIARFNIARSVSPLTTVKVRRMPSIVDAKVLTGALRKKRAGKKWGEREREREKKSGECIVISASVK